MKFDIIIPSWNQIELSINCLLSIRRFSKQYDYRVIWVDNGSDENVFKCIRGLLQLIPHVIIRNSKNLGFVKATNQGLRFATAKYVVLMNNDTEAVENWLGMLVKPLIYNHGIAATGPRTNADGSWQGNWEKTKGMFILPPSAMLAFFCTMFRRSVIDEVGYLDERFGVGFGDDDDYCHQIKKHGYKLALVQDLVIPHHHRSTFKLLYSAEEIQSMQDRAMDMFFEKNNILKPRAR